MMNEAIFNLAHDAINFNRQDGLVQIDCQVAKDQLVLRVERNLQGLSFWHSLLVTTVPQKS